MLCKLGRKKLAQTPTRSNAMFSPALGFVLFCFANWFGEEVEGHKDGGICCPQVKPDLAFPRRAWGIGSALRVVLGRTDFLACFIAC